MRLKHRRKENHQSRALTLNFALDFWSWAMEGDFDVAAVPAAISGHGREYQPRFVNLQVSPCSWPMTVTRRTSASISLIRR